MILRSISIKNLRSIKNLDLEFPESAILFFGDVGSGKTSVLKAIEFALFGAMGVLSGNSLLRRGERSASTELTFELGVNTYTIHRELKTGTKKGELIVKQVDGWFRENGVEIAYSPTELRVKILELLNYSISRYKSMSKSAIDIYRYTVYTPQEEIKKILEAKKEERFIILKDVFEIEKYENAKSNAQNVVKRLNKDLSGSEEELRAIGSPEDKIQAIRKEIEDHEKNIKEEKKQISEKSKELETEKKKQEKLEEERSKHTIDINNIKTQEEGIKRNNELIEKNTQIAKKLEEDIQLKQDELVSIPKIKLESDKSEEELEQLIKELRGERDSFSSQKNFAQKDVNLRENLLKEGKCSLCGQDIHNKDQFREDLKKIQEDIENLDLKLNKLDKQITETEELQKTLREYSKDEERRKSIQNLINEKKERKSDSSDTNDILKKAIKSSQKAIEEILKSYKLESPETFENLQNEMIQKIENQKTIVSNQQSENTALEKGLSVSEKELENRKKEINEIEDLISKKKELKKRVEFLISLKNWTSDYFPTLLDDIERSILTSTASSFNERFKEWFNVLVQEENIDIKIDPENFQPIVIIDGFESLFEDMSGGEKSALSLAYRLALNNVIMTKHYNVKTEGLLILDEPTDGFSEAQVNKMQDIFDKLDSKQLIIISHERTLDSFVTDVFNFKKQNHITKVKKEVVKSF